MDKQQILDLFCFLTNQLQFYYRCNFSGYIWDDDIQTLKLKDLSGVTTLVQHIDKP